VANLAFVVLSRTLRFSGLITMDRRIDLIISRIEAEPAGTWDTPSLAALVNLSPSRFRHLFKQETGTSPAQYLKDFRLRKAEIMLRTSFLSVKQILRQVGLGSNAHFVHDFRKMFGMTPTAYRRAFWRAARVKKSRKKKS
jgi:AraC family transcriptional regulator, arabinose operon regulatory protein